MFLAHGEHDAREEGMCMMEAVAYVAGERHSDNPDCVDWVVREFAVCLNDALDDENRQDLIPYIGKTIGTKGDGHHEYRLRLASVWRDSWREPRTMFPSYKDAEVKDLLFLCFDLLIKPPKLNPVLRVPQRELVPA